MTEEQAAGNEIPAEEQAPESEIHEELQSLSTQLVEAVRSLWDSEESRTLRKEIGDGFVEVGRQLDEAITKAQESEEAQEFKERIKQTMDKARESDVAGKVQDGLTTGLRELNAQLSKLVASLQPPQPEAGGEAESGASEAEE